MHIIMLAKQFVFTLHDLFVDFIKNICIVVVTNSNLLIKLHKLSFMIHPGLCQNMSQIPAVR